MYQEGMESSLFQSLTDWCLGSFQYGWLTSEGQTYIGLGRLDFLSVWIHGTTWSAIILLGFFTFPITHGILHHHAGTISVSPA